MKIELPPGRLRLAFFGTPELARTILEALIDRTEDDVVLVVSQPDRPRGRGQKTEPTPVKALAESRGIPVIEPEKMRDGLTTARLRADRIDLAIVAAYGKILPQDLLDAPRFSCWNVHASILPRHRGASPIQHSILTGDPETGVTLMQMTAGMDEGPMLLVRTTPIGPAETAGALTDRLARLGADTIVEGLTLARAPGLEVVPQDSATATYAPRLTKEMGEIRLDRPAIEIDRQVRALHPWPGTQLRLPGGEQLKVVQVRTVDLQGPAGQILEAGRTLVIATGAGAIELVEVQPAGKKVMAASDFLRGAGRGLTAGVSLLTPPDA